MHATRPVALRTIRVVRKVLRLNGGMRFYVILLIGYLVVAFFFSKPVSNEPFDVGDYVLLGICGTFALWMILDAFFTRMIATETHISRKNFWNKTLYEIAFDDITSYDFEIISWAMSVGDKQYRTPRINNSELHTIISQRAPKALLHAKIWKGGQVPPAQDFKSISTFDTRNWISFFIFLLIAAAIMVLLRLQHTAATILTFLIIRNMYEMYTVFGDISLTTEGITENWPWRKQTILWEDIKAVFRDRVSSDWVYTVVGEHGTITVPSIVISEGEHARKFFYNFPAGTRCINFSSRGIRGSGRRIRMRPESPVLTGILEPEMG